VITYLYISLSRNTYASKLQDYMSTLKSTQKMQPFLRITLTSKHFFCLSLHIFCWKSSKHSLFFFLLRLNQVNAISVACTNGLPDCIEMATSLFIEYKNGTNWWVAALRLNEIIVNYSSTTYLYINIRYIDLKADVFLHLGFIRIWGEQSIAVQ